MILAKVPESERSLTESGSSNKVPVLIPFEEHQRLIDEAAKRASRETLDSFRKTEREREKERESGRGSGGDTGLEGDDEGEIDFFATKTNKSIKNMVASVATLKKAFEQPPSQIEQLMYQNFTQKTIENLSGDGGRKKGWFDEAVTSFAHGLGSRGPELVESLTRNFGSDWVKQTAQGLLNPGSIVNNGGHGGYGGGGGSSSGYGGGGGGQGGQLGQGSGGSGGNRGTGGKGDLNQDAVDQIMALDPNNPEHVAAYAEIQGNIDINDARKMLQIHQDIFMKKMQKNAAQTGMEVGDIERTRNVSVPPTVPVNLNSDIPPVWAQALIGKIMELENKVNQVCADAGVGNVRSEKTNPISYVDINVNENIGKVQSATEFQMELEEETRREKKKLNNKWEDDVSTDIGMISHERRLEEESMRKKPVHDASADMIRKEINAQRDKLGIVESDVVDKTVDEHIEIPVDINSDIDKIEEDIVDTTKKIELVGVEEIKEEENKEVRTKAPRSVIDEPKDVVKEESKLSDKVETKFVKGSQGWLKAQKEQKEKKGL